MTISDVIEKKMREATQKKDGKNNEFNNQGELKSEVDQGSVPQYKFGFFGRIVLLFLTIFVCMFVVALIPQILGMRSGYPFALLACLYILTFVKPVWQTPKENASQHLLKYEFAFLMCTIMSFIYIAIAIPISTEIYDRQVIGIAPGVLIIIPWILTVKLSHYLFSKMNNKTIEESLPTPADVISKNTIPDNHPQNALIEKNKDSASLNREEEKQLTNTPVNDSCSVKINNQTIEDNTESLEEISKKSIDPKSELIEPPIHTEPIKNKEINHTNNLSFSQIVFNCLIVLVVFAFVTFLLFYIGNIEKELNTLKGNVANIVEKKQREPIEPTTKPYTQVEKVTQESPPTDKRCKILKTHPKSKGIAMSFKYPSTWVEEPGEHPNVIVKFKKDPYTQVHILVNTLEERLAPTIEDLNQLSHDEIKCMFGFDTTCTIQHSYGVKLEQLPTLCVVYKAIISRLGWTAHQKVKSYCVFYEDKIIFINCMNMGLTPELANKRYNENEKSFLSIANSFVLESLWENKETQYKLSNQLKELKNPKENVTIKSKDEEVGVVEQARDLKSLASQVEVKRQFEYDAGEKIEALSRKYAPNGIEEFAGRTRSEIADRAQLDRDFGVERVCTLLELVKDRDPDEEATLLKLSDQHRIPLGVLRNVMKKNNYTPKQFKYILADKRKCQKILSDEGGSPWFSEMQGVYDAVKQHNQSAGQLTHTPCTLNEKMKNMQFVDINSKKIKTNPYNRNMKIDLWENLKDDVYIDLNTIQGHSTRMLLIIFQDVHGRKTWGELKSISGFKDEFAIRRACDIFSNNKLMLSEVLYENYIKE